MSHEIVSRDSNLLLNWLKSRADSNGGLIPRFSNEEALSALGRENPKDHARHQGNVQSRVDFACYRLGLPPLTYKQSTRLSSR